MKVEIINNVNGREYRASFDSEQELDSWVQSQLDKGMKCPWGKPDHYIELDENISPSDRAEFVEVVTYLAESEDSVDVIKYKYFIPCEYQVYKDVTPEDKSPIYFEELRKARSVKLSEYDWTQLADAPFTSDERSKYREYRQYLRDLPSQYSAESIHSWQIMEFDEWMAFKGY